MTGTPGPHLQEPAPFPLRHGVSCDEDEDWYLQPLHPWSRLFRMRHGVSCDEDGDWYLQPPHPWSRLFQLRHGAVSCESQEDEELGVKHAHWAMHPNCHPTVEFRESSHHRLSLVRLDLQVVAQKLDAP